MKKVFMLIALVAFIGVSVAPAVAMVNDVVIVEVEKEGPKKAEKEAKKSECATADKTQKAEAKAKSGCAPACESKGKTVAEKEAACETSTKTVAKKEGEKK
jgi:hypothetical protein